MDHTGATTNTYFKKMASPVGELTLIASETALICILWEKEDTSRMHVEPGTEAIEHPVLTVAEQELQAYFAGTRTSFTTPIQFHGTEFQKQVWHALLTIPFGETRTYGQIAAQIGNPQAVRAVGGAANKNPISIIAPCHRVVGGNGKLVGFAGGLKIKNYLLSLEACKRQPTLFDF